MIQKMVIAVTGVKNSGKTSAIKEAYSLLIQEKFKEDPNGTPTLYFEFVNERDFVSVIIYNNYNVALISQGDTPKQIKKHLETVERFQCPIIICAVRQEKENGDVINALEPEYKLTELKKIKAKRRNPKTESQKEATARKKMNNENFAENQILTIVKKLTRR